MSQLLMDIEVPGQSRGDLPSQVHCESSMFSSGRIQRTWKFWSPLCASPARGFTLLELLVVMVIIGLLASYVAPRYFDQIGKSEVKATRAQLDAFEKALGAYRLDVGHYPNTEQGLKALVERPPDEPKWSGPYLSKNVPPDPWGRSYIFRVPGEGSHEFELQSLGKDGQRGGSGLDADISVWDTGR